MLEYKIKIIERGKFPKEMTMKFGSIFAYNDFVSEHVVAIIMYSNKPPVLLCTRYSLH